MPDKYDDSQRSPTLLPLAEPSQSLSGETTFGSAIFFVLRSDENGR